MVLGVLRGIGHAGLVSRIRLERREKEESLRRNPSGRKQALCLRKWGTRDGEWWSRDLGPCLEGDTRAVPIARRAPSPKPSTHDNHYLRLTSRQLPFLIYSLDSQ